nr:hypothetical protein CFP56_52277 [Quercus suber]
MGLRRARKVCQRNRWDRSSRDPMVRQRALTLRLRNLRRRWVGANDKVTMGSRKSSGRGRGCMRGTARQTGHRDCWCLSADEGEGERLARCRAAELWARGAPARARRMRSVDDVSACSRPAVSLFFPHPAPSPIPPRQPPDSAVSDGRRPRVFSKLFYGHPQNPKPPRRRHSGRTVQ